MTPIEASKEENEVTVRSILYSDMPPKMNAKFRIGEKVRVSKYKRTFEKGYQQNYTTEIFAVCEVLIPNPVTYRIKDENNEIIEGIYNEQGLVKYDKKYDVYLVERVISKKKVKGKYKYLVRWKGYPDSMNSWVDSIIQNLS